MSKNYEPLCPDVDRSLSALEIESICLDMVEASDAFANAQARDHYVPSDAAERVSACVARFSTIRPEDILVLIEGWRQSMRSKP